MSYDLVFWRESRRQALPPQAVYEALMSGETVGRLEPLPVEDMLDRLRTVFPGAVREPNGTREWVTWEDPASNESFQVEWTLRHVHVACRGLHPARMNALIDWAHGLGCPLYDPQTGERFA